MKDPNTNPNIHFESESSTDTSIDNSRSNATKTLEPEASILLPIRDPGSCSSSVKFTKDNTGIDYTNVFLEKGSAQETNSDNLLNVSRSGNELDAEVIEPINVCDKVSKQPRSIIWNYELTCKLIELRNTTYKDRLDASVNNSKKRRNVWYDLGQDLGIKQDPTAISSKYRDLYSIFMTKLKMEERSGSGSVNWKYMKIFEHYLGKEIEQDPPGKLESGGGYHLN